MKFTWHWASDFILLAKFLHFSFDAGVFSPLTSLSKLVLYGWTMPLFATIELEETEPEPESVALWAELLIERLLRQR